MREKRWYRAEQAHSLVAVSLSLSRLRCQLFFFKVGEKMKSKCKIDRHLFIDASHHPTHKTTVVGPLPFSLSFFSFDIKSYLKYFFLIHWWVNPMFDHPWLLQREKWQTIWRHKNTTRYPSIRSFFRLFFVRWINSIMTFRFWYQQTTISSCDQQEK